MNTNVFNKFVTARAGELIFFFFLIPAFIFLVLIHIGDDGAYLFVANSSTGVPLRLPLAASAENFLKLVPEQDISYQVKFAIDYVREGSIAQWVLNLWPPGMPVLYGLVLKLSGTTYFPLKIISLATSLYAFISYLLYRNLSGGRFSVSALMVLTFPLLYRSFHPLFLDIGLFSSDFYCFVLLAILMFLLFEVLERGTQSVWRQMLRMVMIGFVLAALAYFRSFYYLYIKLFTIGSLFTLVAWGGYTLLNKGWKLAIQGLIRSKIVASIGISLLVTWLALLPWKLFLQNNQRPFEWTATNQVWSAQWRMDLPSFFAGMNTPCILERKVCEQLMPFQYQDTWADPKLGSDFYKRMSIATFVSSPLMWYGEKAKVFHNLWFDAQDLFRVSTKDPHKGLTLLEVILYIPSAALLVACVGLAIVSVVRLVRNFVRRIPLLEGNVLHTLFLSFFSFNWVVFTFLHYEARYSIPLKWVTLLVLVFLLKEMMHKFDLRLSTIKAIRGNQ